MSTTSPVVVITGASEGIGAELARQLGPAGYRLVLAARRLPLLQTVAAASGPQALAVQTDVTRRAEVQALHAAALAHFGQVDVWVNNAGRGINRRVLELTDEDVDDMMAINLKSALYGIQTVIPYFQQRRAGHLINISSFLGRVPSASFRSAYNAAKHALNSLTANLRMDLAADYPEIHISLVMPGAVSTAFPQNARHGASLPLRSGGAPIQTPAEVAAAIANVIAHPVAERYTNRPQVELVRQYYQRLLEEEQAGYEAYSGMKT